MNYDNYVNVSANEMEDRIAIFIDGSNLYHALHDVYKRHDINFAELTTRLCGGRRLFRTYYYNLVQEQMQNSDGFREQQDFLDSLRNIPYVEVRLGTTKLSRGISVEKGIDIMLATDLLHFGWDNLYDVAILVSGDGDFAYALQAVKNLGKHVEVAYFERNISKDLLDVADRRYLLDRTFFKGIWLGKRQQSSTSRRKQPDPANPKA